VRDFELVHVTGDGVVPLAAEALVVCTEGSFALAGAHGSALVGRGESLYVSADEGRLTLTGAGTLFIATTPR
jgi:mannose-6-phosphate isomerase